MIAFFFAYVDPGGACGAVTVGIAILVGVCASFDACGFQTGLAASSLGSLRIRFAVLSTMGETVTLGF